jgi:hypothetical protein
MEAFITSQEVRTASSADRLSRLDTQNRTAQYPPACEETASPLRIYYVLLSNASYPSELLTKYQCDGILGPDEIARTLALMDQVQPFEFTEQERAELEADRQGRKEWEKAHFDEHADRLRSMWQ